MHQLLPFAKNFPQGRIGEVGLGALPYFAKATKGILRPRYAAASLGWPRHP